MGEVKNKEGEPVAYYRNHVCDSKNCVPVTDAARFQETPTMVDPYSFSPLAVLAAERAAQTKLDALLAFARDFGLECRDIVYEKNQRYAECDDPFKNFRLGGTYGIVIRMTDKVSRLLTMLNPAHPQDATADESIEDTCKDLANYAMLLAAMRAEEKRSQ